MPWIHDYMVVEFEQFVEEAVIELSRVAAGHVCSAAFPHEESVACQQYLMVNEEAYAVWRVSRSVNHAYSDGADQNDVAVVDWHVGARF
jgi:hypothetical protein